MKSYEYKGFVITKGLCDAHPDMWCVMDFNDYDENVGSKPTGICAKSIKEAREEINNLIHIKENIPF